MSMSKFTVSLPPSRKHGPDASNSPPRVKKRIQVARACDWCRVHRVKCDSERPCATCRNRGGECSSSDKARSTTLPQALQEIDRLTERIQQLEQALDQERNAAQTLHTPSSALPSTPGEHDAELSVSRASIRSSLWEGIHISTARSPQKTWYGPSSLFYFIGRINTFLTAALSQSHSTQRLLPQSASTLLDGPTTTLADDDQTTARLVGTDDPIRAGESLSPTQEEYFISLFWQSFYTTYPLLDEQAFKDHYNALWADAAAERKPSPLVDIVIAVCMQYGMARLPAARRPSDGDASIAGRWHYRRCQTLLAAELESPTIATLQCHLLSSIYLCGASFQNMADNACGLAVRTAYMLGLHLEPPATMPRRDRELRKRLWWLVYVLESKMSMKLGRPFLLPDRVATCSYPADDRDVAALSGSSFAPLADHITWLTWSLQTTRLMVAARKAYRTLYQRIPDVFAADQPPLLHDWLAALPDACKTARRLGGAPFSTDCSPLEIEPFAPLWLQRERLLLELMYHNLRINLYRPSICIALAADDPPPVRPARTCAAHAVAFVHLIHQVLTETTILTGWSEAFQWSWNAAMTIVGFLLAYPRSTPSPRAALDLSVVVFESYAQSFAVAASAAAIMRDLRDKVDLVLQQSAQSAKPSADAGSAYDGLAFVDDPLGPLGLDDDNSAEISGVLGQSIDIFSDTYHEFDWSGMNGGGVDAWAFLPPRG